MADKRRKLGLYLHHDEEADLKSMEVIDSISQRVRGDFLRQCVIAGSALHALDPRIPKLLATLFDGQLTAEQLVSMIRQTTDWRPDEADIRSVVEETLRSADRPTSPLPNPATETPANQSESQEEKARIRRNMDNMFGKPGKQ